jgi:hypothetical protein
LSSSIKTIRTVGIVLTALMLHGLGATEAAAQRRGVGVPSVGGAGIGPAGLDGTDLGGTDLGGLGGSGGSGLGVTDLGGVRAPTLRIPLQGAPTPSDAVGQANGAQGTVSSAAGVAPVNTATGSLMDPVTNEVSRATNAVSGTTDSVLAPVVGVPGQVGAAARQPQNGDAHNRVSGVPPPGERRFVAREVVVGLASDLSASTLDDLARRHGLTHLEAQPSALVGTTYHRWRIGDGRSVSDVIRALEADGVVRTAQPNYNFSLAESPQSVGRVSPRNTRRANFTSPKRTASRPAGALSSQ